MLVVASQVVSFNRKRVSSIAQNHQFYYTAGALARGEMLTATLLIEERKAQSKGVIN